RKGAVSLLNNTPILPRFQELDEPQSDPFRVRIRTRAPDRPGYWKERNRPFRYQSHILDRSLVTSKISLCTSCTIATTFRRIARNIRLDFRQNLFMLSGWLLTGRIPRWSNFQKSLSRNYCSSPTAPAP